MPYSSMKDVNPALKGIKPPITLAQANMIAEWADKITGVDSPWAVAIANFKKAYTVKGGSWVKKASEADDPDLEEVIKKEGSEIVLYSSDGSKVLGRFPFGTGKKYPDEKAARAAAHKREGQVQFFKHQGQAGDLELDMELVDVLAEAGRRLNRKQAAQLRQAQQVITALLSWVDYEDAEPGDESAGEQAGGMEELAEVELAESASGHVLSMEEWVRQGPDRVVPLHVDVALIRPGWGNKRDNHYYPREVLARDADVFKGVKMYETDHRENQKSTRTWVSTVTGIKGIASDGSPIATVSVHDKDFAERLVALATDGLLDKMECSILAGGTAKRGKVGGRLGNVVEAITSADSVDWVTRAGAGGRALALTEAEEESMSENTDNRDPDEGLNETEENVETTTLSEKNTETPAPEVLAEEKVEELLSATNLPDVSKDRLREDAYADEAALKGAINAEVLYLKEVTKSGKPFGQGASAPRDSEPLTEEQKTERFNRTMREIGAKEV